jgi:hypothetical protein
MKYKDLIFFLQCPNPRPFQNSPKKRENGGDEFGQVVVGTGEAFLLLVFSPVLCTRRPSSSNSELMKEKMKWWCFLICLV